MQEQEKDLLKDLFSKSDNKCLFYDDVLASLLNNLLGGPGMNSRLNVSLRERHGLVYTVESSMASYGDTGVWCTYFGCDNSDVKRCLRLLRHELDRVVDAPLSPGQLQAAKRQILGQLAITYDNHETLALDMGRSFLHGGL